MTYLLTNSKEVNFSNFFYSLIERIFIYAVQLIKFDNMRSLITIIFSLLSALCWSQNTNEITEESEEVIITNTGVTNNTNMNSNSNGYIFNKLEETEKADSVIIEMEELDEMRSRKDLKAIFKKEKEVTKKAPPETLTRGLFKESKSPVPGSITTKKAYEINSYEFSETKKESSIQRSQRSPTVNQQMEMDKAVGFFEVNAPNSFEFHYFNYAAGNYDVSQVNSLQQAEILRPDNADVHVQKAAYNIIKRNNDSAVGYLEKLKTSGRLTENVLHYAEDILLSVPENGVLVTHGFDDSYASWYQQNSADVRKDVKIVSLDFMQSEHYRLLLKEDGFSMPKSKVVDVDFLKEFCELNATKSISVSLTTPKEYFAPIQSKLYVTGLVFEYHEEAYDNFHRNDELWNSELKKHLIDNALDEKSKQLSSNYLLMLLQLRKVYAKLEEEDKLKQIDEATDKVSVQCHKYEQVQKLKSAYK